MDIFSYMKHLYGACETVAQVNALREKLYNASKLYSDIRKDELRICEDEELNAIFSYDISKDTRIKDAYEEGTR